MKMSIHAAPVVVYAPTPLTCLGMVQFIRELPTGGHCVLSTTSLSQLQQQLHNASARAVVAELSGTHDERVETVTQLLTLSTCYPALNLVVYTASRDVNLLTPLRARAHCSLIARQGSLAQLQLDMAQALAGQPVCSTDIAQCFSAADNATGTPLTPTEFDVLQSLYDGLSLTDIATSCQRSVKTISAHKRNIMRKLGAHSDAELFQTPLSRVVQADQRTRVSS